MLLNSILLQTEPGGPGSGLMQILMIVALIAIFYFFMIRPQNKKQKEIRKFREGIQKGDKVITAGGIYGTVKEISDTYFLLEISDAGQCALGVTICVVKCVLNGIFRFHRVEILRFFVTNILLETLYRPLNVFRSAAHHNFPP